MNPQSIASHEASGATDKKGRAGNLGDASYSTFLGRVRERFLSNVAGGPLFTTDVDLWPVYLDSFPPEMRQFHNCNACRRFIGRYGALVTIDESGMRASAMWEPEDADSDHEEAVAAMLKVVIRAKVMGVFLSPESIWGQPTTGVWTHLHVLPPKALQFSHALYSPGQVMAEKAEDFKNVQRALEEFPSAIVTQALTILKADALYRSEKVLGPAQWLATLHAAIENAKGRRDNLVWRAVATAPAGFCHPRSSMVGTLLEDLAAGLPFDDVARKFAAKMHPLQYQRPQAAPSAGNIAQAEKIIEQLNAAGSLARRYAQLDEVEALWRPTAEPVKASGGVFGHLVPKEAKAAPEVTVSGQVMTWQKFERTLLPSAKKIELLVPSHGAFTAIVTAANPEAPPILQWDLAERRNPFSWYFYHNGSDASSWVLTAGQWTAVKAITAMPHSWFGGRSTHHGDGAIFIIDGARDLKSAGCGAALFPEIMKSDFHAIRATIEAYSRSAKIADPEKASACGLALQAGNARGEVRLRVSDGSGAVLEVRLDRWD